MSIVEKESPQTSETDWLEKEYSASLVVASKMFELMIASAKISLIFNGSLFAAVAVITDRSGVVEMVISGGSANPFLTVVTGAISILAAVFNWGALVAVRNYDVLLKEIAKRFSEIEDEVFGSMSRLDAIQGMSGKSDHIGKVMLTNQSRDVGDRAAGWTFYFYSGLIVCWLLLGVSVNIIPIILR